MKATRAEQIMKSEEIIGVQYRNNYVWIEDIDKERNTAHVTYLEKTQYPACGYRPACRDWARNLGFLFAKKLQPVQGCSFSHRQTLSLKIGLPYLTVIRRAYHWKGASKEQTMSSFAVFKGFA